MRVALDYGPVGKVVAVAGEVALLHNKLPEYWYSSLGTISRAADGR